MPKTYRTIIEVTYVATPKAAETVREVLADALTAAFEGPISETPGVTGATADAADYEVLR